MSITSSRVEVFLGDVITHATEREFLARLRSDLERRDCAARIHANFVTLRGHRQVDFLIVTDHRLVHAELKTTDPALPLLAPLNGPWAQRLPTGELRTHNRNYYRQAHDTTYSISDDMHALARRQEVPMSTAAPFFTEIHTVVCVQPDIPVGSQITRHKYVETVGYGRLLELLTTAGPRPRWTSEHWDAYARYLQLVREHDDSPQEAERRASIAALEDYRRRFAASYRRDLHEHVPMPAHYGDKLVDDSLEVLTDAANSLRTVVFNGPSGCGKTHTAQHAALAVADAGAVPVWVAGREYVRGQLSRTVSRAIAPFTTETCLPLLRRAVDAGSAVVLFIDGLNEIGPDDRLELLRQLNALRLRLPVAVVLTTTAAMDLPEDAVNLTAELPGPDSRMALLSSYGRAHLEGADAFVTPMELVMAVHCANSLPPAATSTDLFEAYVTARCPAETVRAGLRTLAAAMDEQLHSSLTIPAVRVLLHRGGVSLTPDADIDAVLNSRLLAHTQGHVAFSHDLLARFLAAEQLVLAAPDTATLADQLRDPSHLDLAHHAVALEHDAGRRRDLLLRLADPVLLCQAARGRFGVAAADAILSEVVAALTDAATRTTGAQFVLDDEGPDDTRTGTWRVEQPRTLTQQALLVTAGMGLAEGLLVQEVGHLLDVTDRRCAAEMRALRAGGHRAAITTVVAATYSGVMYSDERELWSLPASIITTATTRARLRRDMPALEPSAAETIWQGVGSTGAWGRLMTAITLLDRGTTTDLTLLPALIQAAWDAGGYHTRLAALRAAQENSHWVKDANVRRRIREVLEGLHGDHIVLNSLLFEALAAYGGIDQLNSEESIRAEVAEVLAAYDHPEAWRAAQRLVGMVFEDSRLHGPYDEVLVSLHASERLRLHVMAARSEAFPFHHDWILAEINDHIEYADDATRDVIAHTAVNMDWGSPFRQETIAAHVLALRGWAKLAEELPPAPPTGGNIGRRTWRVVDELLFALLKDRDCAAPVLGALWSELVGPCAPAAVDALVNLRSGRTADHEFSAKRPPLYQLLLTSWSDEVRNLFEWGLRNPDRLIATFDNGPAFDLIQHVVQDLSVVGDEGTVALLRDFVNDFEVGTTAVASIREIQQRLRTS